MPKNIGLFSTVIAVLLSPGSIFPTFFFRTVLFNLSVSLTVSFKALVINDDDKHADEFQGIATGQALDHVDLRCFFVFFFLYFSLLIFLELQRQEHDSLSRQRRDH